MKDKLTGCGGEKESDLFEGRDSEKLGGLLSSKPHVTILGHPSGCHRDLVGFQERETS